MQLIAWPDAFCQGLVERGFRVIRFDNRDCGLSSKIHVRRQPNVVAALAASWLRLPVRAPYTLDDDGRRHGRPARCARRRARPRRRPVDGRDDRAGRRGAVSGSRAEPDVHHVVERQPQGLAATARREAGDPRASPPIPTIPTASSSISPACSASSAARPFRPTARSCANSSAACVRRGYYPAGVTRQLVAIIASGDRRRLLRKITAPTLVIHGADDPLRAGRGGPRHGASHRRRQADGDRGHGPRPRAGAPADPRRRDRRDIAATAKAGHRA